MRTRIEKVLREHWLNPPDLNFERATEIYLCGLLTLRTPLRWARMFDGSIRWADWNREQRVLYPKRRRNHHYKDLSPVSIDKDIEDLLYGLFQLRRGQPRLQGRPLRLEPIIMGARRTLETCLTNLLKENGIVISGPKLKRFQIPENDSNE